MISSCDANFHQALNELGVIGFVPKGNSMWPFIINNKHTVIIRKKEQRLKPLDVAFYKRGDSFVLHRVVRLMPSGYVMRGDSRLEEENVLEEQVIGVMVELHKGKTSLDINSEKYLKKIQKWYKNTIVTRLKIKLFNFFNK